jgi:hypothetical protein
VVISNIGTPRSPIERRQQCKRQALGRGMFGKKGRTQSNWRHRIQLCKIYLHPSHLRICGHPGDVLAMWAGHGINA